MPGTAASRTARARNCAHSRVDAGQRPETTKPDKRRSAPLNGDTSTRGSDMTPSSRPGSDDVGLTCVLVGYLSAECDLDGLAHKSRRVPASPGSIIGTTCTEGRQPRSPDHTV